MRRVIWKIRDGYHWTLDRIVAQYYHRWACPRGHHKWKFSGCMYCGSGDGRRAYYN